MLFLTLHELKYRLKCQKKKKKNGNGITFFVLFFGKIIFRILAYTLFVLEMKTYFKAECHKAGRGFHSQ